MKRYFIWLSLPVFGLLFVLVGLSQQSQPLISINKISILPAQTNTRILLESSAPLQNINTAYSKEFPSILVVELGKVQMPAAPAVPADGLQLIKDVKIQMTADLRALLFLTLKEAVPYRIFVEAKTTVIELTKIHRSGEELIAPETQQELNQTPRKSMALADVEIADKDDRLDITARLGQKATINIFALHNPLRLVTDIYDAVFDKPTQTYPFGKFGVEKIKIGQFKTPPPYFITRLVLELKEPRLYAVSNSPKELTISFPGESSAAVLPPAPAAQSPTKTAAGTEAKTTPPANPPPIVQPTVQAKEEKKEDQAKDEKLKAKTIHDTQEKYSGELLSPRFKDADLRDVVLWLGERVGLNVMFDPNVRGTVTCTFVDVPWDQFLDLILLNNNQGRILEGNVLRIAPLGALAEEERALQTLRDAKEQGGPLLTKTFTLSYAKAKDVLELIKNKKSARGEVSPDERTNTIIVSDVAEKLDLIEKLIDTLDTQTPQVQIETRIIEATTTFVQNQGIQWGSRGIVDPFYGNQTSLQFPNKVIVDGAMIPQGQITKGIGGPLGGYGVNLPAPSFNSVLGISLANILDTFRLDMAISALETSGNGRIVSSQRVTAQNNKEAYINQGRQIPVQTQANFTVTTQYVNAGLELRATPQITAEGTIIMTLDIQNNAADFANLVNGIPPITTQSARTTVMVPDGGTTVIGGIYRVEDAITRERVPFLYRIPLLGNLFRSFSKTTQNRELLIFITPRILK
jgi:type IV pilus assembly protein PilQ